MKNEDLTPMEFVSSHGTFLVNEDGTIHKDSDLSDWLLDIEKVDIAELDHYNKLQGLDLCEGGDVCDFGYWDKKGKYHIPEKQWRFDIYHSIHLSQEEQEISIEESFKWISENRK